MTTPPLPFVRDRRFAFDLALGAAVTLVAVTPAVLDGVGVRGFAVALMINLPLMLRRRLPEVALTIMVVGSLLAVGASPVVVASAFLAVPVMIYSLARWSSDLLARVALAAGVLGSVLAPASWFLFGRLGTFFGTAGLQDLALLGLAGIAALAVVLVAYVLGRRRRESLASARERQESETERVRLVQAELVQRDQAAAVAERNRIARELHDIVAHSLSVIVVQAEGGRALAAKRPEQAAEVLGTIAETGREALGEMRRIVGVLRSGPEAEAVDYVPAPGLEDIPELVARTTDRAELTVFGELTPGLAGPALGLSAYRLVQESLTNVLKHAGPTARSRVTIAYTATGIELEVSDDGVGASGAATDGHGHGLEGMAERVALHDGGLSAEPGPYGGWVVRARLPYDGSGPDEQQPGMMGA